MGTDAKPRLDPAFRYPPRGHFPSVGVQKFERPGGKLGRQLPSRRIVAHV